MIYFYCKSYQAFNLALATFQSQPVTVITPNGNIIKACEHLGVPYVGHKPLNAIDMIRDRKATRKEAARLVDIIQGAELHVSHTQLAVFCFYLIKRLVLAKGKVVFHTFEFVYSKPTMQALRTPGFYKQLFYLVALRSLYRLPLELRHAGKAMYVISLSLDYLRDRSYRVADDKDTYYQQTLELFRTFKMPDYSFDFLFIAQTFSNKTLFHIERTYETIPVLAEHGFHVKMHPLLGHVKELESCPVLPDYLPVELFLNSVRKAVVSFHSAALVTAAQFPHIRTISLIDIVKGDETYNEKLKQHLISQSNDRIYFPQSIGAFRELLRNC